MKIAEYINIDTCRFTPQELIDKGVIEVVIDQYYEDLEVIGITKVREALPHEVEYYQLEQEQLQLHSNITETQRYLAATSYTLRYTISTITDPEEHRRKVKMLHGEIEFSERELARLRYEIDVVVTRIKQLQPLMEGVMKV